MDELVQHCLREIAFDGDLGCRVSRLRTFIEEFYAGRTQGVDDTYFEFIWTLLVKQPSVRVGTVSADATAEVFVAPQPIKRKKNKDEDRETRPVPPIQLEVIEGASDMPLDELVSAYGDALRAAVDPQTTFIALTGSHVRTSKLSEMVYTALQLISRGRATGLSVVDLGRKTGYDQKTCWYLVQQLVDLDLVVKLRQGGVGANFCVHKHFFEHEQLWQEIRGEAAAQPPAAEEDEGEGADDEEFGGADVKFDPIDARHLSSLQLVKARIVKLLKASDGLMHPSQNLIQRIGFRVPQKPDRRFFQTRLRELIDQGVIERVTIPHPNPRKARAKVQCVRLVNPTDQPDMREEVDEPWEIDDVFGDLKANITLHKQIIDLLEKAGTSGMTLNELTLALHNFDKRTLELLLSERGAPPHHLADLHITQMMETHGKERRYRYYTLVAYRSIVAVEGLDDSAAYAHISLEHAGGFARVSEADFYRTEMQRDEYVDNIKGGSVKKDASGRTQKVTRNRKRKREEGDEGPDGLTSAPPTKKKHKRLPKSSKADEAAATGCGPSSKAAIENTATEGDGSPQLSSITLRLDTEDTQTSTSTPKKRSQLSTANSLVDSVPPPVHVGNDPPPVLVPKKRGRPRKVPPSKGTPALHETASIPQEKLAEIKAAAPDVDQSSSPAAADTAPLRRSKRGKKSHTISSADLSNAISTTHSLDPGDKASLGHSIDQQNDDAIGSPMEVEIASGEVPSTTVHEQTVVVEGRVSDNSAMNSAQYRSSVVRPLLIDTQAPGSASQSLSAQPATKGPARLSDNIPISPVAGLLPMDIDIPIDPVLLSESTASNQLPAANQPRLPGFPLALSSRGPENADATASESKQAQANGPRPAATSRAKGNVSLLRRENEFLKLLADFGGIANPATKDFVDAHVVLMESLAAAGQPTSGLPHIRVDKRTSLATLDSLESKGKIKILRTSVPVAVGAPRHIRVAYLPSADKDQLDIFMENLSRMGSAYSGAPRTEKVATTSMSDAVQHQIISEADARHQTQNSFAAPSHIEPFPAPLPQTPHIQRPSLPLELLEVAKGDSAANAARADKLSQLDDVVLRELLLTERTTLSQLYGFLPGKALRARQVHLTALDNIAQETPSKHIVSKSLRIFSTSLYFDALPLATYCSLISILDYSDELSLLLSTEDGRKIPVSNLSQELYHTLQIGKARSRARLLDLFDMLHELRIVTPLRPSTADDAPIKCASSDGHPTAFVPWLDQWSITNKHTAPVYWQLNDSAPLYLWVLSESSPPFWKDASASNRTSAEVYWKELELVSTDRHQLESIHCPEGGSATGPQITSTQLSRSLRRPASWKGEYELTWHQRRYLRRYVDVATADTPLEDTEHGAETLARLVKVTSVPTAVMTDFFTKARVKQQREIERIKSRQKNLARSAAEEKTYGAQRAAEALAQKEEAWNTLIARVHPEPLLGTHADRVARVKMRFVHGGSTSSGKWESEIQRAVQEADMATEAALASTSRSSALDTDLHSFPSSSKTVRELIDEQGPVQQQPVPSQTKAKKKARSKSRGKTEELEPEAQERDQKLPSRSRRRRFLWTRDYDELAQDAMVIIRARCKDAVRVELSALEQVFPAVPRNAVRQRVVSMRDQPNADAYLKRLEERWSELWHQYRGSEELPDSDPTSTNNFDLVKHIEFLRRHIDKTAIRVGFAGSKQTVKLPATAAQLEASFNIIAKPLAPTFDFVWNLVVEEGREKGMLQHPFYADVDDFALADDSATTSTKVAESALKMVFGTPNDRYDPDVASALLRGFGEQTVSLAKNNLLARGVLAKLVRDPTKPRPGRTLKISDINSNALGGSIPRDTFQDASGLETLYAEPDTDWREWPPLASDGDLAMIVQAASSGEIAFKVDASNVHEARRKLDGNSKKVDDDDLETSVLVKLSRAPESDQPSSLRPSRPSSPIIHQPLLTGSQSKHGLTTMGDPACCRVASAGLADCDTCLCTETERLLSVLTESTRKLCEQILTEVAGAGQNGLVKTDLVVRLSASNRELSDALHQLVYAPLPLVYAVGYGHMALVAAQHIKQWTVTVCEDPLTYILPRRWLDTSGRKISDIWESALRAVVGVIVFRPGISLRELRWRLRSVYDAHEIIEALSVLLDDDLVRCVTTGDLGEGERLTAPTEEEEQHSFWFLGERPWYQV